MTMRQLVLSIYPDHSDFEENAAYLKLGQHYGFTRIFMSMLEVSGTVAETKAKYQKIIDVGNQLGYQTILDVSPRIFKQLGISYKDLKFFADLHTERPNDHVCFRPTITINYCYVGNHPRLY